MLPKKNDNQISSTATESSPLLGDAAAAIPSSSKDHLDVTSSSVEDNIYIATSPQFHSLSEDVIDTIKLGVPIFIAMLSWVGVSSWMFIPFSSNHNLILPHTFPIATNR
jgi:hypothetical protein